MKTRIKFIRLGRTKPQDIVLHGNASDDTIVEAIDEVAPPARISLVRNRSEQPLAFYVDGGRLGEGVITREWT